MMLLLILVILLIALEAQLPRIPWMVFHDHGMGEGDWKDHFIGVQPGSCERSIMYPYFRPHTQVLIKITKTFIVMKGGQSPISCLAMA